MVTGLKTSQKNSNLNTNHIKELSIQVNLNGLSFCILNRSENCITYLDHLKFDKKLTPSSILEEIKKTLSSNTVFSEAFNSVNLIYQNELATIVPQSLYDELHKADYLKFNSKILQTDFIEHDEIVINDSVVVYVPYMNINNYIFETFGEFTFKHASTVLIDTLLQRFAKSETQQVFINVNSAHIEMVVINHGALQFYNYFEFQTVEDFIYYVLFSLEQLQFNPEEIVVNLTGDIEKDDASYAIAYKYIRHIQFYTPDYIFKISDNKQLKQPYQHFIILNSF